MKEIPREDTIWEQENEVTREATYRILDFSKYVINTVKLFYDDAEDKLKKGLYKEDSSERKEYDL